MGVRWATRADLPAIAKLIKLAYAEDKVPRISDAELEEVLARGEMIVLSVKPGEVIAAACLTSTRSRHVAFCVTAPGIPGVDARIRGIASALGEATLRYAS
jgi:hypothetical protein